MDDPITWKAVQRVAELVRGITIASGYRTDVGTAVSIEPIQLDDDTAFGAVVYLGTIEPTEKNRAAAPEKRVAIVVDAYVGVALENAQLLQHNVYADIEQLFATLQISVPGMLPFVIGPTQFLPRTDDMATAGVQVVVQAIYRPKG